MPTTSSNCPIRRLAGCEERVFPTYPMVSRYFPSASAEDARRRLCRSIDRGDGPALVIGPPGTGKSLLLQALAAQYHERFDIVLLACARLCTRRALMQAILFELGLPYKLRDEGQLRLSLLDHLLSTDECPSGLLLLVDEAQTLPITLLDELRVVTNLVRAGAPRVRLVLAGASGLEESFAHPALESFAQRLATRCYLSPLRRDETMQFIHAHLAAAGAVPENVFAADACQAVFEATDGIPRLVNQLCDRALWMASDANAPQVDRRIVQAAWAELQQLPMPADAPASGVVEFGNLSDGIEQTVAADLEVIEPTELDAENEVFEPEMMETGSVEPAPRPEAPPDDASLEASSPLLDSPSSYENPFCEEFDEEEIVLDQFAAWDDMFHRHTPRVANRRDPSFSACVRSALEAAEQEHAALPPRDKLEISNDEIDLIEIDEVETVDDEPDPGEPDDDEPGITSLGAELPPLRLAVVSDRAQEAKPRAKHQHDNDAAEELLATFRASHHRSHAQSEPVLIVEEDSPIRADKPTVRREDYKRLFSRLRSG